MWNRLKALLRRTRRLVRLARHAPPTRGGPPQDWVDRVRRGAPHLLEPGPPDVALPDSARGRHHDPMPRVPPEPMPVQKTERTQMRFRAEPRVESDAAESIRHIRPRNSRPRPPTYPQHPDRETTQQSPVRESQPRVKPTTRYWATGTDASLRPTQADHRQQPVSRAPRAGAVFATPDPCEFGCELQWPRRILNVLRAATLNRWIRQRASRGNSPEMPSAVVSPRQIPQFGEMKQFDSRAVETPLAPEPPRAVERPTLRWPSLERAAQVRSERSPTPLLPAMPQWPEDESHWPDLPQVNEAVAVDEARVSERSVRLEREQRGTLWSA